MTLFTMINAMSIETENTTFRDLTVVVKTFNTNKTLFIGTVNELIQANKNKEYFGASLAQSWLITGYNHFNYVEGDQDRPLYNKSILIEVF